MKQLAIGIDIGGTNTVFGLIDRQGNIYSEASISTKDYSEANDYVNSLCGAIQELLSDYKEEYEIVGIGIGAPNANFYRGSIQNAPNLEWANQCEVPLVSMISKHFSDLPILLTNDANAAAMGEMIYGGAKKMKDFIMITLGTGLGSGIVSNGELVHGSEGFAGELGHIIVVMNGRSCGCGRRGCLETYVSATGIRRTATELLSQRLDKSSLSSILFCELTSETIYNEAKKGDPIALEAFDFTARALGIVLANVVAITSPEAIFLFGGLAKAGDFIFKATTDYMEQNMMNIFKGKVKLLPSMLEGKNVALLGASALIWNKLKK